MPNRPPGAYAEQVIHPSAARTATGNSAEYTGYGDAQSLLLMFRITALSGTTPTLALRIQDTVDGTNWRDVAAVTGLNAATAAGTVQALEVNNTKPFGDRIRLRWEIAGTTPSFTFDAVLVSQAGSI